MQESLLRQFNENWHEDALAEYVGQLPEDAPWRLGVLRELVKIDLRRHWERGTKRALESYLLAYPELGTPETVSVELIQAEIQARRRMGDAGAFADLSRRFPWQMQQLQLGMMAHLSPKPEAESPSPTMVPPSAPRGASASSQPAEDASASVIAPVRKLNDTEDPAAWANTIRPEDAPADASVPPKSKRQGKNRYRIIKELGRGAMGTVYLAEDTFLQRQVAMKLPHFDQASPELLERFNREVLSAANLAHPNICPVFDVGENKDGTPYLVMAYIEGEPLTELIASVRRERKPLAQRRAAQIAYKLASALEEAHRRNIVHRDLKPANVMMDRRGEPIIMDFGLARRTDDQDVRQTQQGSVLGTPAYMPPEQAEGKIDQIGPASDQYSLGVILYELLTGEVPFKGNVNQVMVALLTKTPAPPSALRPDLDPALEQICLKAMAFKAGDRYPSVADFAQALEAFVQPSSLLPRNSISIPANPAAPTKGGSTHKGGGAHSTLAPEFKTLADPPRGDAVPPPALESAKGSTVTPPAPAAGWKRETAPAKPRTPSSARGVLIVLLVMLGSAVAGWFFFLRAESPAAFQARVLGIAHKGDFREALKQIDAAAQEPAVKNSVREDVRDKALVWAGGRLEARQNLAEVVAVMDALLEHFRDHKQLKGRRAKARETIVQAEVEALLLKGEFRNALLAIRLPEFAGATWFHGLKDRILRQWALDADSALGEQKYRKAVLSADTLLKALLPDEARPELASKVSKEAGAKIEEIKAKVDALIYAGQFGKACQELDDAWREDEDHFRDKIKDRWYARAAEQKGSKKWLTALETLRALGAQFSAERMTVEKRKKEVIIDRARAAVEVERTLEALQEAEKLLTSADGELLAKDTRADLLRRVRGFQGIPQQITLALRRMLGPNGLDFVAARDELTKLETQASTSDKDRIAALSVLLKKAEASAAARPPDGDLDDFGKAFTGSTKITQEDKDVFGKVHDRLLEVRIRHSILHPPAAESLEEWKAALREATKHKGKENVSDWARAWRLECRAELARAGEDIAEADLTSDRAALPSQPADQDAGPYVLYVGGLADSLPGLNKAKDRARVAKALLQAFAGKDPGPELRVAHRKGRAAGLLLEAAEQLPGARDINQPFGSKDNADTAYTWLAKARSLSEAQPTRRLLLNLALAGWHKNAPDKEGVAAQVALLTKKEVLDEFAPRDAYQILLMNAETRLADAAGRGQAIDSYQRAAEFAHQFLRTKEASDTTAFAEHVYRRVIGPALAEKGGKLLGAEPEDALKARMGQLCARLCQMIRSDLFLWAQVKDMKNPLARVVDLYDEAYQLAGKAEYLVHRAFTKSELATPDIPSLEEDAAKAKKDETYWGGYSLSGYAKFLRSRQLRGYDEKVEFLGKADKEFATAAKLAAGEKNDEHRSSLYRYWSSVSLELGNYLLDTPEKKEACIRAAESYADKATKLNDRNLAAWDALAYAREDIGKVLFEAEKQAEAVAKYREAVNAFTKAIGISFRADAQPWLGRGRALYRLAVATRDKKDLRIAEMELLAAARRAQKLIEKAEADYWLARVVLLQRASVKDNNELKEQLLKRAEKSLERCHQLARQAAQNKTFDDGFRAEKEEASLTLLANLALTEARARQGAKGRYYLKRAEQLATALKEFNAPEAALIRHQVFLKSKELDTGKGPDPATLKEALGILVEGAQRPRQQDSRSLVNLYVTTSYLHLNLDDPALAVQFAEKAEQRANQAKLDRKTCATAAGALGISLFSLANNPMPESERMRLHARARGKFRTAIKGAPSDPAVYIWRLMFIELLLLKGDRTAAETAELRQTIAEARANVSPFASNEQKERIEKLSKDYPPSK